ncbi:hypothetical protein J6590_006440 [Homalodisca vitripennis]|nr:hypothetical protein J6590_006440 [Homalodisca vitripennis]
MSSRGVGRERVESQLSRPNANVTALYTVQAPRCGGFTTVNVALRTTESWLHGAVVTLPSMWFCALHSPGSTVRVLAPRCGGYTTVNVDLRTTQSWLHSAVVTLAVNVALRTTESWLHGAVVTLPSMWLCALHSPGSTVRWLHYRQCGSAHYTVQAPLCGGYSTVNVALRTTQSKLQTGVQFVNKLPNPIKNATMPKAFKTRLETALISKAFYNTDEFMAPPPWHGWVHGMELGDHLIR